MLIEPRIRWPEWVALVAAAVAAGGIVFLWLVLTIGVGSLGDTDLNRAALGWLVDAEVDLVLPLWVGLRAVHTGIAFVRRYRSSRRMPAAAPGKVPQSKTRDG